MKSSDGYAYPPLPARLYGVWFRHMRVYTKNLLSNGLPPFLEPLIFLGGIGLGLGKYITEMDGVPYIEFLATGLLMTSSMFTAAFECSFGTFIRLEFDKVYDGMLAAPMNVGDLIAGEIIWAGTKGFFFSCTVLIIVGLFGLVPLPQGLLAPFIGFFTGVMFATLSLTVTSFVKTINHFNFYFTGLLSPMFFFAGVVFPLENLPPIVRPIAEIVPLTHSVRLVRSLAAWQWNRFVLIDLAYIFVFVAVFGTLAISRLKKRLVL
ncbi:MAG: ABC transporter [Chitinivibrionales bacterium]|nr:ABC transporter [Chitinivibrionales bacterium]